MINHGIVLLDQNKDNVLLLHTKNVDIQNYNLHYVLLKIQFHAKLIIKHNVYQTNNNVIHLLISLDVKKMVNLYQLINNTYVNLLIMINVLIHYIQYYVQMDNADKV